MRDEDVKRLYEELVAKLDIKAMLQEIGREFWVIGPSEPEVNEEGEVLGFMGVPK
jgi:hypothetical protein